MAKVVQSGYWVRLFIHIILAAGLLFVIDQIWLVFFSREFYLKEYSKVQNAPVRPRMESSIIWYFLMAVAIAVFVLPRLDGTSATHAAGLGALMGLVLYGTNNAENRMLFGGYSRTLANVDTLWGIFLFTVVTLMLYRFQ